MGTIKLLLAGGFLGSGKTTAIQHAATYLQKQGKRTGIITNDQGTQQVDTMFIHSTGIPVEEVANGCFCCRYQDLEKSLAALQQKGQAGVVFAESVGSCTDLAATVINPLLGYNPGAYDIVLSVFADVRLLLTFLQNSKRIFFNDVNYIYQKQLEEADVIIVNKIDLLKAEELLPAKQIIEAEYRGKKILYQNSLLEDSIQQWLSVVLGGEANPAIRPTLAIDYDTYAAGEAEMAWLDEEVAIATTNGNAAAAAYVLMDTLYAALTARDIAIGHLKFFLNDGEHEQKISFTTIAGGGQPRTAFAQANSVTLLINARVQIDPALLIQLLSEVITATELAADCKITEHNVACFKPGYPRPTHRIAG
jgi:G3E family GTPase